jgi:hypothetical protein
MIDHQPTTPEEFESLDAVLQRDLAALQEDFAMLDLRRKRNRSGMMQLLLKQHRLLRIKMDGNRNHHRAHLHVDYHQTWHMSSFAIDNGELLGGDGAYSRVVQPWITQHRTDLIRVWEGIRASGIDQAVVARLNASPLGK